MKSSTLYRGLLIIAIVFGNGFMLWNGTTDSTTFLLLETLLIGLTWIFTVAYTSEVKEHALKNVPRPLLTPIPPPPESKESSEIKYDAILANIGDGLIVTNKKGEIITFNKAAENMLGWKSDESLGKKLQEILRVEYESPNEINSVIYEKHLLGDEALYIVRKNDSKFLAAIKVTSFGNETELYGTITLFRDITLEQNIDQMKNEFITLASHQLKTPLSTIRWYIMLLLQNDAGDLLPQQRKFVETIRTATFRMIDLVNALLNISRIESGRIIIDPKPTDLKAVITDAIADMQTNIDKKEQKIEVHFSEGIPTINLDSRFIRQIYLNLLSNASKYSPDGKIISITVTTKDNEILSEVKDSGYGIPAKDSKRVFNKFYRGDNVVTKVPDGTGLGLYLVKAIVMLSGGKIWYESTEEQGTTFWFTLPLSGTPEKKGVVSLEDTDPNS